MKSTRRVLLIILVAGVATAATSLLGRDDRRPARPLLTAAPSAKRPCKIAVGPNVQISRPHDKLRHTECVIAADPADSRRLFASAMFYRKGDDPSLAGYYSHDGGLTWQVGFELDPKRRGERLADESLAYGPDGELYLGYVRFPGDDESVKFLQENAGYSVEFLRSTDGGVRWQPRGVIPRYVDRPWLAVDRTSGPFRGRVYWSANVGQPLFAASRDGAASFGPLVTPDKAVENPFPSQPAVLADGSVVWANLYRPVLGGVLAETPRMAVFRSDDGGRTVREVGQVGADWRHPRLHPLTWMGFPQLAADVNKASPHRGRLYCVWFDGREVNHRRVIFSRSDDRGASWSPPEVVSEQSMDDNSNDYAVTMPTVAVNPDGVVAVAWYDRRGLPAVEELPGGRWKAVGYNVRLRVSLDGGRSWSPSVQVNEVAAKGGLDAYGHTAGLTAAADGRFFPAWVDDRTGHPQLWTAPCSVQAPR